MRISILVLMLMILAGAAQADLFPCSEEGVNAAIAEAALGNAGPHALDCTPGDSFQTVTGFGIRNDLILDGRGVTIECYREDRLAPGCRVTVVVGRELLCNFRDCGENIWGPPPNVTLENFDFVGTGADGGFVPLLVEGILFAQAANLVLQKITFASNGGTAVRAIDVNHSLTAGPEVSQLDVIDSSLVGSIQIASGSAIIERSLIKGSQQFLGGVSVFSDGGVQIRNSTIHGQIWNAGSTVDITNSTLIAGERAGGGVGVAYRDGVCFQEGLSSYCCSAGDATFSNTIVSGACQSATSLDREFCSVEAFPAPATLTSLGGNLESPYDFCQFTVVTDQANVTEAALNLGPLQDNFGPTHTNALLPGSVAIDAAVLADCPLVDQRGAPRPETGGTSCDSGAFEAPEPASSVMLIASLLTVMLIRSERRHRLAN